MRVTVNDPTHPGAKELTKEDVWGKWTEDYQTKIHSGMVVAKADAKCPIWGDTIPYKSVTVVCAHAIIEEVSYWLEYVHGGDSISQVKRLPNDEVAIRSNYMCW